MSEIVCWVLVALNVALIVAGVRTIKTANKLIAVAQAHAVITDRKEERIQEKLDVAASTAANKAADKVLSSHSASHYRK